MIQCLRPNPPLLLPRIRATSVHGLSEPRQAKEVTARREPEWVGCRFHGNQLFRRHSCVWYEPQWRTSNLGEMGRGLSAHCRCSNANALSRLCSYPEFDPLPFTVFRNQDKPKRLQIVVRPNGSAVDFVGTYYSGFIQELSHCLN
ncbi:hypothetical protein Ancab_025878 [Ancistrocladus abbreviatus]